MGNDLARGSYLSARLRFFIGLRLDWDRALCNGFWRWGCHRWCCGLYLAQTQAGRYLHYGAALAFANLLPTKRTQQRQVG